MKKKFFLSLTFALSFLLQVAQAQTPISLQEAIDVAVKQNLNVTIANQDLERTRARVRETASGLYPKVNAVGAYQYYLQLPKQLIPAQLFGGEPGTYIAGNLGTRQTTAGSLQLNQNLYNGQLLVGIKAARVAENLNQLQIQATKEEIIYNVSATYFNIQTLDKQLEILQRNLENSDKLIASTRLLLNNGITNKTAYNKLLVSRSNITAQVETVKNTREKQQNLLKYLMGVELSQPVAVLPVAETEVLANQVDLSYGNAANRTDLRLLNEQKRLSELDKKSIEARYIPTITASVNYGLNGFNSAFAPFSTINNAFYPSSVASLNLNIPVFDGFEKRSQIAQKKLDIAQTQTKIELQKQTIAREIADAIADYNSNQATLKSQDENRKLAEKIYNDTQLQFKNGIVSMTDVINAQTEMETAQNNYINALTKVRIAELDLKKAKNELLVQ